MKMHLEGLEELRYACSELPRRIKSKADRQAILAATTPVVRAVKAGLPTDSGALKRGITRKVTTRKGVVVGRVGAKRSADGKATNGKPRVPSRYLHLVEKGTKPHGGHPGTPARGVLRQAQSQTRAQVEGIAADKYRQVIESEASKLGRK